MSAFYLLIHGKKEGLRVFPPHGFTEKTIAEKRLRENTTVAALSYNVLLPFLTRVNKAVEAHIDEATEVTGEQFLNIAKQSSIQTAVSFTDFSARVAVQTGMAAFLVSQKKPICDAVVYSWDMYPRLHRKYFGDVLQKLHLPRFIAGLLGPESQSTDLAVFQTNVAPEAAFEDSIKRHVLYAAADVIVDTGRALIESETKLRTIVSRLILHSTVLLSKAGGAAAGRAIKGDVGEYWGEYVGIFTAPYLAAKIVFAIQGEKSKQKK